MYRLAPALLSVALLGCRDTASLEIPALQAELDELTARVEAMEADAVAKDATIAELQLAIEDVASDVDTVGADVSALSSIDLTDTLDAITAVEDRIDALDEMDLATEEWVVGRGYASTDAVDALQTVVTGNTEASSANGALIATNSAALSTQLTAILGNTSAASDNAQLIAAIDARTTVAEAAAAQAGTDVARIDAALLALDGTVVDLDNSVDALDTSVAEIGVRLDSTEASLTVEAGRVDALVDADVGLQASIDANGSQLTDLASELAANASDIAGNAGLIADNAASLTGLEADIASNSASIATNTGDVATNVGRIAANSAGIDAVAADLDVAVDLVADLETEVAGSSGEVGDVMARVDLLEIYTDTQWVAANTTNDANTGPIPPMALTIDKQLPDSMLLVEYDDNLRTNGGADGCRWEVRFNGQSCTSPGKVAGDVYVNGQNSHKQHAVVGYCRATSAGSFGDSDVDVSVHVLSSPGYSNSDCYTGWQGDQLGVLRVTEVDDPTL